MSYLQNLCASIGHQPIIAIGATVIVSDEHDAVLMQLRSDTHTWGLPGGAMEIGETLEETARRELREETGLEAERMQLLGVFSGPEFFFEYPNGDQLHSVVILYKASGVSGEMKMTDGESLDLAYFPLDQLPLMDPRAAVLLRHVRDGHIFVPGASVPNY